jgi:uncharacterized protein YjbI with pentapeptide repeats
MNERVFRNRLATGERQFVGADLSGADLSNLNLHGANLSGAILQKTDLSGANLSQSSVAGFWLSTCRLQGVVLDDIVLDDEYWRDPILQITALWDGAEAWTEIRRSKVPLLLNQSNFAGATLNDIDLSDVAFVSSVFTGAYFAGTGLDRCSFRVADLNANEFQGVTCRGLSLEEAQLSDSRWTDVAMSDGKFVRLTYVGRYRQPMHASSSAGSWAAFSTTPTCRTARSTAASSPTRCSSMAMSRASSFLDRSSWVKALGPHPCQVLDDSETSLPANPFEQRFDWMRNSVTLGCHT